MGLVRCDLSPHVVECLPAVESRIPDRDNAAPHPALDDLVEQLRLVVQPDLAQSVDRDGALLRPALTGRRNPSLEGHWRP